MKITRRKLLQGLTAAGATLAFTRSWAATELELGDIRITTLSDGHLVLPESFVIGDLPEAEARAILAEAGAVPGSYMSPCNVTLLRAGPATVLFDAGAGEAFMDTTGQLPSAIDALGLAPEEITHVVFTHAHPDHLWGAVDDFDEPLFRNARHLIGDVEHAYWTDPATLERIGPERQSFAAGAARRLEILHPLIETFKDESEILPGVVAHATHGHTPGHMAFDIADHSALVVGDAIGNAHLALARPGWSSPADQDPEMGARTRETLLKQVAETGIPVIGFHLPDGGIGQITKIGSGYQFQNIP